MSNNGIHAINFDSRNFEKARPKIIHFIPRIKTKMAKLIHMKLESNSKETKETVMINSDRG